MPIQSTITPTRTAAELLVDLLTVDGAGSLLDSDLLDGQHGAYYMDLSTVQTVTGAKTFSAITTVSNATAATGTIAAALVVTGGIGATSAYIGGAGTFTSHLTLSAGGLAFSTATPSAGQLAFATTANTAYFGHFGNPAGNLCGFSIPGSVGYQFHTSTLAHTFVNGTVTISNATAATSPTAAALVVTGGIGATSAYIGGALSITGITTCTVTSATAQIWSSTNADGAGFAIQNTGTANGYFGSYKYCIGGGNATDFCILGTNSGAKLSLGGGGAIGIEMDASAAAGNTRLLIYDVDNATVERVTVGAADSGGAGYKVLRIPN